jgi:hypothetical protein
MGAVAGAGHDAMNVRMMVEILPPCAHDRGYADCRTKMLRIGGDRGKRLRRGREQQAIDLRLVLICNRTNLGWQRNTRRGLAEGSRTQIDLPAVLDERSSSCRSLWVNRCEVLLPDIVHGGVHRAHREFLEVKQQIPIQR